MIGVSYDISFSSKGEQEIALIASQAKVYDYKDLFERYEVWWFDKFE